MATSEVSATTGGERPDTATEDDATIRRRRPRSELVVPAAFADRGYEALPAGPGNLWGIDDDCYIYRPLRAWDAAQVEADRVVALTSGGVYTLTSAVMTTMRGVAALRPEEREDGTPETPEQFAVLQNETWVALLRRNWSDFLAACPAFEPFKFARGAIEKCDVRRVPASAEAAKHDDDPTKDHGGPLFKIVGAGSPDAFYRGRRDQLLRVGLCAFWGSCGDFFGVR